MRMACDAKKYLILLDSLILHRILYFIFNNWHREQISGCKYILCYPSPTWYVLESIFTHCVLVTPSDDKDLRQHWAMWLLAVRRPQAITWTNIGLMIILEFYGTHIKHILQKVVNISIRKISL